MDIMHYSLHYYELPNKNINLLGNEHTIRLHSTRRNPSRKMIQSLFAEV